MIEVKNLSFKYANTDSYAIKEISIDISDSEFILLTGPSGCGKTSLCRCINGLIPSFHGGEISGEVLVNGTNSIKTSSKEMARTVGMVFQDPENQLVSSIVEQEIAFGLENFGIKKNIMNKRIEEVLDAIGISHLRHRNISSLSGGEKQKVAIAGVLVLNPSILILDEPTSELDPKSAEEIIHFIKRLNEDLGLTIILVEHRIDRVLNFVDRLVVMKQGRVQYDDNPQNWSYDNFTDIPDIELSPVTKLAIKLNKLNQTLNIPLNVKSARNIFRPLIDNDYFSERLKIDISNTTDTSKIIRTKDLSFRYDDNGPVVLNDINLEISKGEFVVIIGRNSSGKTTLVKLINGLLKPSRGNVLLNNQDISYLSIEEIAKDIGFVFQDPNIHLFADTVEEEITFMMNNLNYEEKLILQNLESYLNYFKLQEYKDHYPRNLSTGEKQRVALASILAAEPEILILDEPTRGLDYQNKMQLMKYLCDYQKKNKTIIMITHDIEIVAQYAQRVIMLGEGRIIADGEKHDILSNSIHFTSQINKLIQPFKEKIPKDT